MRQIGSSQFLRLMVFMVCCLGFGAGESFGKEALIKRSQYLMGTLVFVTGVAPNEEVTKKAVAAGLAEIRRIEHVMSTWIPTSELSQVNAAAGKTSCSNRARKYGGAEGLLANGSIDGRWI